MWLWVCAGECDSMQSFVITMCVAVLHGSQCVCVAVHGWQCATAMGCLRQCVLVSGTVCDYLKNFTALMVFRNTNLQANQHILLKKTNLLCTSGGSGGGIAPPRTFFDVEVLMTMGDTPF